MANQLSNTGHLRLRQLTAHPHRLPRHGQRAGEIGDIPINESGGDLSKVFVQVHLASGQTVPIQLMWSNRVRGPQQP
jgi:hypothetical protein